MTGGYDIPRESFRVMAPFEQARFAPDGWGFLLRLRAAGALGELEVEQVIERALVQVDGRIGVEELRALVGATGDPALAGDVTVH